MKRIQRLKDMAIGALVMTLILTLTPVLSAASYEATIDVIFDYINITVNGDKVEQPNILYNGTTYVPLRAVAEMMGYQVDWIAETSTADIYNTTKVAHWEFVERTDTRLWYDHDSYEESYSMPTANSLIHSYNSVNTDPFSASHYYTWSEIPTIIIPGQTYSIDISAELTAHSDPNDSFANPVAGMNIEWLESEITYTPGQYLGTGGGEYIASTTDDLSWSNSAVTDETVDGIATTRTLTMLIDETGDDIPYLYITVMVPGQAAVQYKYKWVE